MPIVQEEGDGIVSPSPTGFPATPVQQVKIVSSTYADIAVDLKQNPIASIISHISGSSWVVTYYSQLIDTDTPLIAQSVTLSGTYLQYVKISDLELKVDKPLNKAQQESITNSMQLDGGANIYIQNNQLIPNVGDGFVANVGVEAPMVFRVTSTEKLAIFKEAAYHIEYAIVSTGAEYIEDLESKTVKELVFVKDNGIYGLGTIIETEAANAIANLSVVYRRLLSQYFPNVFDPEFQTLIIPQQSGSNSPNIAVYDPFLTQFITEMFTLEDSEYLPKIRVLNVSEDKACKQDNFWKAIKYCDATYLKTGFTRASLVYSAQFNAGGWNNGIRATGIDCCVYPLDPKLGVFGLRQWDIKIPTTELIANQLNIWSWDNVYDVSCSGPRYIPQGSVSLVDSPNAVNEMYPQTAIGTLLGDTDTVTPVTIYPVLIDDNYVLSANFYAQNTSMSVLETAVWSYLNGQELDGLQLSLTADLVYQWGVLEQFYYIPILMVLIRAATRTC